MKLLSFLKYSIILCFFACSKASDDTELTSSKPSTFKVSVSNITKTTATINWTSAHASNNNPVLYDVQQGVNLFKNIQKNTYTFTNLEEGKNYKGVVVAYQNTEEQTKISFNFTTKTVKPEEVTSNFTIPANLSEYYKNINFKEYGNSLKEKLAILTIAKHNYFLTYFERHSYLYDADRDPDNNDNVLLIYSGESRYWKQYQSYGNNYTPQTFNTEHIFPKSKLEKETSKADLHLLRVCDASVNTSRWNYPFANGEGAYGLVSNNTWYPGDEWKGDVARIVMYVHLRYNEPFSDVSTEGVTLLLKWNKEDPVSTFEIQRNNLIYKVQGNRNPFIDNPILASKIWGRTEAENTWK